MAALLAAAALGCGARAGPGAGDAGPAAEEPGPTRVVVDNENWLDVTVYAVRAGSQIRLGTVTAKTEVEFALPELLERTSGELHFLVDPLGSTDAFLSDGIAVRRGDEIVLRIESVLGRSTLSAY